MCSGAFVFDYQGKNQRMHATPAATDCQQHPFAFQELGSRRVEVDFSGGHLSSDGGALLLREMDAAMRLGEELAGCFSDFRDADGVEHELPVLLRQRILGLALGDEDLIDHDRRRVDPRLAAMCGRAGVLGEERILAQDKGRPLAGKSTLNRLELGAREINLRPPKIQAHPGQIEALLLARGVAAIPRQSGIIVLDFDATDDPRHGHQEGRFYHGCSGDYRDLPLSCFCGDLPLWAQWRTADRDGGAGTLEALKKIVAALRQRFGRRVRILVRGDRGFCRDELMTWIEAQPRVHDVLGLARNRRPEPMLAPAFWDAAALLDEEWVLCARAAGAGAPPKVEGPARAFAEWRHRTRESWSAGRRVIGRAEITNGENNPRFIVTDITRDAGWIKVPAAFADGRSLYEEIYCARGGMENRIKEQPLDMFADRTSTAFMSRNQ